MPRPSPSPSLGRLELSIMQILWQNGPCTARQITDALNEKSSRPVAHSTVQTILRKMETKNAIVHESDGRIFRFRAVFAEQDITVSATHDLVSRVFRGSAFDLAAHLLKQERMAPEERQRLRELIDRIDAEEKGQSHG